MITRRAFRVAALLGALGSWSATAQPEGPPSPVPGTGDPQLASSEPEPLPPASEVVPRLLDLEEDAARTRSELAGLDGSVRQARELEELALRMAELRQRLDDLVRERDMDGDRVARLRAVGSRLSGDLDALLGAVSVRFRRLEDLEARWQAAAEQWQAWSQSLRAEVGDPALAAELRQAQQLIEGVREDLAAALPSAREGQRRAQALVRDRRTLELDIERVLAAWAASLKRRTGAVVFTPAFFAELKPATTPMASVSAGLAGLPSFFERNAATLLIQALVALLVAFLARWLHHSVLPHHGAVKREGAEVSGEPEPLARPWALGLLAAVAGLGSWHEPGAGSWQLLPDVVLAVCLVLLASAVFERRRERLSIVLLALLWVAFELARALPLSWPAARLVLLALAVTPLGVLAPLVRREGSPKGRPSLAAITLRLSLALLAVVVLAEALGFHPLAMWLFKAGLRTGVLVFVAALFFHLSRALVRLALHLPGQPDRPAWKAVSAELGRRATRAARWVVVLAALLFSAEIWHLADSPLAAWQKVLAWNASIGDQRLTFGQVLLAAVALYVALALSWLLRSLLDQRFAARQEPERGVTDSVKILLHYSLAVLGVLVALSLLGLDLKAFAIVAGAFGVGIGFGLQNIVSNFVSGIILLFERPVRTGDVVVVAGETGEVRRIGLRSTVLQTLDRSEVIVPNSQLIAEKVTNWTLSSPMARLVLPVGVAYGSSIERVEAILLEIAGEHPEVLAEPAPSAPVVALGESAVELELRVFLADFQSRPRVTSELARAVLRRFAVEGLSIPFPQRDVHLNDRRKKDEELRNVDGGAGPGGRAAGESGDG